MRTSSIAKAGVILLVLRLAGVALRYVAQPPGALPGKLAIFLSAAMYHAGALLLVIGLFVAFATLLPRLKWPIAAVACLVLTPTVFRETVDPIALGDWTAEYSRLIERDRVWSDTFLHQPSQP
jgi:hypothetical protein